MKNYITHLEFIIAILSISLLLFSSCDSKNNKHIQPSKETMDSGTVEVYYEDTYKIKELYNNKKLIERLDIIYLYPNRNLKDIEDKIILKNIINLIQKQH